MSAQTLGPSAGRVPPADLDAEAAVLSALFLDPTVLDIVREVVDAEDFYADCNQWIFRAIDTLERETTKFDAMLVANWLRGHSRLDQVGGTPYIGRIVDATPAIAHVEQHAQIVADAALQRRMIAFCQKTLATGYEYPMPRGVADWTRQVEAEFIRVVEHREQTSGPEHVSASAVSAVQKLGERWLSKDKMLGARSGLVELDRRIAGFERGTLYLVAGRPGMGKSAMGLKLATGLSRSMDAVWVYMSLEMPNEQLSMRLICSLARVSITDVRNGSVTADDIQTLGAAAKELDSTPLFIRDIPSASPNDLRSTLRRALREARLKYNRPDMKLGGAVFDHIHLGTPDEKISDKRLSVSAISNSLLQIAKSFDIPVIGLAQLNRGVETRKEKDKRPAMSDVRESGTLEEDAAVILLLYRDEYYFPDSDDKGVAEVIVAKQRNGPTGTVKVAFRGPYTAFDNLAYEYEQYDDDITSSLDERHP